LELVTLINKPCYVGSRNKPSWVKRTHIWTVQMGTVFTYRKYWSIDGTNLQSYQVLFRLILQFKLPRLCTDRHTTR